MTSMLSRCECQQPSTTQLSFWKPNKHSTLRSVTSIQTLTLLMACIGFDAGSRFSVVARVHSRGLTTCLNEVSDRSLAFFFKSPNPHHKTTCVSACCLFLKVLLHPAIPEPVQPPFPISSQHDSHRTPAHFPFFLFHFFFFETQSCHPPPPPPVVFSLPSGLETKIGHARQHQRQAALSCQPRRAHGSLELQEHRLLLHPSPRSQVQFTGSAGRVGSHAFSRDF